MKAIIDASFEKEVQDLQSLIRIPSVSRGEPEENMPYGRNVEQALVQMKQIARDLGFENVWDVEHRCGVIEYGQGEEVLAIMGHLDVVPEGTGWSFPPYGAEIHDGKLFGRGTIDDKGPAIAALYAMAAVKEAGYPTKRRVRLLLGLDEECGCTGMARYKEVEGEPAMAFTPDAVYPVVNSEMGILHATYGRKYAGKLPLSVGTVANVIPGEAEALLPCAAKAVALPLGYTARFEGNRIHITGKMGHASMPELAKNALQGLLFALKEQDIPAEDKKVLSGLSDLLAFDDHGETLGLNKEDESGRITFMPTMLKLDENGLTITFDCRYPFSHSYEAIRSILDTKLGALGLTCLEDSNTLGHFIPKDSELVSTLLAVYQDVTGDRDHGLVSMGGGTYAKLFKNAVAFGPVLPGQEDMCHMPDEHIALEDLRLNTLIMAEAIRRLACE